MKLPSSVDAAIAEARAKVCVGYPWWLRPFMARNVIGITLGRRIYLSHAMAARTDASLERLLRHELIHVAQVNRLGLVRFLVLYVAEFLRHFWRERSVSRAYRLISFEIEAYAAEQGL